MGVIRGALAVFVSILLLIVFLAVNTFLTLTLSLQYKNVQEQLSPIIQDTLENELGVILSNEIANEIDSMNIQCEGNSGNYVFNEGRYSITLSCNALTQGTDAIIASGVESLIESYYYKEYTCDFWKCFGEEEIPLFLVSDYARNYWKNKLYLSLAVALGLMVLLFLLFKKKHNTFVIPGILLMAAALPFLRMNLLMSISFCLRLFSMNFDRIRILSCVFSILF